MPEELKFKIVWVSRENSVGIDDSVKAKKVTYQGKKMVVEIR